MSGRHGRASSAQGVRTVASFADHLADEIHPCTAAIMLGFNPGYGWQLLAKVRRDLGWQAI